MGMSIEATPETPCTVGAFRVRGERWRSPTGEVLFVDKLCERDDDGILWWAMTSELDSDRARVVSETALYKRWARERP